jgi:hypothetical protein
MAQPVITLAAGDVVTCRSTGARRHDPAWHAGADHGQPDNPEALVNTVDRAAESGAFRAAGNPVDRLSALPHVRVRMPVGSRVAVSMRLACQLCRHHHDASVTHAALGYDAVGELPHIRSAALEHRHLHAVVMIEVNVQRCLCQIMTVVGRLYEPLGQVAGRMFVYEDERADALATFSCVLRRLLNSRTGEVSDRFRSILVSAPFDDTVKVRHQVVVQSNSNTSHNELP